TYLTPTVAAFSPGVDINGSGLPTFTCDGSQHQADLTVSTGTDSTRAGARGFENGNVEVGLYPFDANAAGPRFEHALVGSTKVRDTRAKVVISVNAYPETTKPGAQITVAGTDL